MAWEEIYCQENITGEILLKKTIFYYKNIGEVSLNARGFLWSV